MSDQVRLAAAFVSAIMIFAGLYPTVPVDHKATMLAVGVFFGLLAVIPWREGR